MKKRATDRGAVKKKCGVRVIEETVVVGNDPINYFLATRV